LSDASLLANVAVHVKGGGPKLYSNGTREVAVR